MREPRRKLLIAHQLFPSSSLYANDLTDKRIQLLQENVARFGLEVDIRTGPVETYPANQKFDLNYPRCSL